MDGNLKRLFLLCIVIIVSYFKNLVGLNNTIYLAL